LVGTVTYIARLKLYHALIRNTVKNVGGATCSGR